MHLSGHPSEAALFVGARVIDPRYLTGGREKILLDEHVMLGKKNAEARVRMVPADDAFVRVKLILYAIDCLPGILREGDVSTGLSRVHTFNRGTNLNGVVGGLTDQNTTDLGLAVRAGVLANAARYFAVNLDPGFGSRHARGLD